MEHIKISVEGKTLLPPQSLHIMQGNLKSLSKESYEKLKSSILKDGFCFVIHVWFDGVAYWVLDGTQRLRTILRLIDDGYECPHLPCAVVEAKSFKDAARKLLRGAGMYGRFDKQGLYELMGAAELDIDDLTDIDPVTFEVTDFVSEFFDSGVPDNVPEPNKEPKRCPHCNTPL